MAVGPSSGPSPMWMEPQRFVFSTWLASIQKVEAARGVDQVALYCLLALYYLPVLYCPLITGSI